MTTENVDGIEGREIATEVFLIKAVRNAG